MCGFDVPYWIIAHLTMDCGGNVHSCGVVDVTCGSSEMETHGASPHSGAYHNRDDCAAKKVVDWKTISYFYSAYRMKEEDIPHTRNNWICSDFKERKVLPTHYALRLDDGDSGWYLKSWFIKTSVDGENWQEVAREEDNRELAGCLFTTIFPVAGGGVVPLHPAGGHRQESPRA
jgi:hypothetical protein